MKKLLTLVSIYVRFNSGKLEISAVCKEMFGEQVFDPGFGLKDILCLISIRAKNV